MTVSTSSGGSANAGPELITGAIIPTFRHVSRLPHIVARLNLLGLPVIIVDDGNSEQDAASIAALENVASGVRVRRRAQNGGKGAAVKDGLTVARSSGWTHAIQIDADGQHDLDAVPAMLAMARETPGAVICGVPVYDSTIPRSRKIGREITHFWVRLETLSNEISDSMCGLRIYPVAETVEVLSREMIGDRMDFDTEILVHLNWRGLRIREAPVKVTYPEGNVSNFRMWSDNVRISLMHTRLAVQAPVRVPLRMWRRSHLQAYRQ
jgi:glycosyltransferase involved in cell wall biosynthesis